MTVVDDRVGISVGAPSIGPDMRQLWDRFPPRGPARTWPATEQPSESVLAEMVAASFAIDEGRIGQQKRRLGMVRLLGWLSDESGDTWQQRWEASGANEAGNADWWKPMLAWARPHKSHGSVSTSSNLRVCALMLVCADVIRPSLEWLLSPQAPQNLVPLMTKLRDPDGFAELAALCDASQAGRTMKAAALRRAATILVVKGGTLHDVTVGDCLELSLAIDDRSLRANKAMSFYQLLHEMGVFGPEAPTTLRAFGTCGQLSPAQLIDRHGIVCRPVRDLLVAYLAERQPMLDHTTLRNLAFNLGGLFWRDLERHHPGIASFSLAPEVSAAWKQRMAMKTRRVIGANGEMTEVSERRAESKGALAAVRGFYLDIAQWAMEDPARWGQWAAPCPIRIQDLARQKEIRSRKSRMDQRTRERLPLLAMLQTRVDDERLATAACLQAAEATEPGASFTIGDRTLHRAKGCGDSMARVWVTDPERPKRRDATGEEDRAFWTWAAVETLRHTGIRIEELTELSQHSLIQYTVPDTGEIVPLLQIAPYDSHERVWNAPMPLLFQRRFGIGNRAIPADTIRGWIGGALEGAGTKDASGRPLRFTPHDFRRMFITDVIMHGMPPHIAQLVAGHRDINTTMGYKAVYPEEVINGHRAFIARRRALRPSAEYRVPTEEEWEEFLGHFERRKVALGTCGRSYATPCIHEHSCVRCPLLRPDLAQRGRLIEIRDNLIARIAEARNHGWLGEADGLQISLAGARQKLDQLDQITAARSTSVRLGMPTFPQIAGRLSTVQTPVR